MGISIREFQVAMEVFGAKRLEDKIDQRFGHRRLPVFEVAGIRFHHSGSNYILHEASDVILREAIKKSGKKDSGWYEIYSVKLLFIVACMLENKYTAKRVEALLSETYRRLLSSELVRKKKNISKYEFPSMKESKTALMNELCKLVEELDELVNPFGNEELTFREPGTYMDKVRIEMDEVDDEYVKIILRAYAVKTTYLFKPAIGERSYQVEFNEWQVKGDTSISHYRSKYKNAEDEIIFINYKEGASYGNILGNIRLKISLTTGLAWDDYKAVLPKPATQKQIKLMIEHLNRAIINIKRGIIDNITE